MLKLTIFNVPGHEFQALGLVKGNVVQSKNIGRDLMAGLKGMAGGEIKGYTEMMTEARQIATARMEKEAEALGANAIIGIHYTSSSVMDGTAEIIAYGTAVKVL